VAKLERLGQSWGERYLFHCPGCECGHFYDVSTDGNHPSWQFNGDMDRPTFTPSLLVRSGPPARDCYEDGTAKPGVTIDCVCHLFLTDGVIHYLGDCTHRLAGQSVPLPEIE
jgi:hypothetical protein